jgi:hypothetical protein
VLAGAAFALILRWKSRAAHQRAARRALRRGHARRRGLRGAVAALRVVLLRIFLFFLQVTAMVALLPLVARELHGGGPAPSR